jgi:hypothetical protein
MTKRLGTAALTVSVLWAVISLVMKGGVGVSQAIPPPAPDFNLTSAKAEITHETADRCFSPGTFISCGPSISAPDISLATRFDSDSYEILANLALLQPTEFATDLNETIAIVLSPGTCGEIDINSTFFPAGSWFGIVPGSDLHHVTNKNFNIYNFEGNIPTFTTNALNETTFVPTFDRIEFNLKIPTTTGTATLSLEGNANLCSISGPMALSVFIPDIDADSDFSCVNIPAPEYETLDISQAFCGVF